MGTSKLYKIFDKHRDAIRESGGITGIWVVEMEGKSGNKYCGFSQNPPELDDEVIIDEDNEDDILADSNVPFKTNVKSRSKKNFKKLR